MVSIDLSGKTAVVTGGGQGLGAAICQSLYGAGANVVVNYFADEAGVNRERAHATAEGLGQRAVALEADVRDPEQVGSMLEEAINRFGALDILINNAGIVRDRTIQKMSRDEWDAVIDTNLTGVFNVSREAAARLSQGGCIVNVSSVSGIIGIFGQTNYAAAKAGVIAMTKVMSKELAKQGVRVNAVAPGVVLTELGKTIPEPIRDQMVRMISLGRFGEPEEIAHVVLFLCSDLASYINGEVIRIDGGWAG
jgi:3-oxoacyl-[acyl-carrier protein] reductase